MGYKEDFVVFIGGFFPGIVDRRAGDNFETCQLTGRFNLFGNPKMVRDLVGLLADKAAVLKNLDAIVKKGFGFFKICLRSHDEADFFVFERDSGLLFSRRVFQGG